MRVDEAHGDVSLPAYRPFGTPAHGLVARLVRGGRDEIAAVLDDGHQRPFVLHH